MVARIPTDLQRSAGGVLYRHASADGALEICLISTRGGTRWQLPKGHANPGESEDQAAVREVREETGCTGDIECDLGEITFWFVTAGNAPGAERRRVKKSVHFYLVRYREGDTSDHDAEVDDARWWPAEEATRLLTFDSERKVLARARARLAKPAAALPTA